MERADPAIRERSSIGDNATLFIIDDDTEHSVSLERLLVRAGLSTKIFSSIESAVSQMSEGMPRWILCDAHMPDGGAEKLLQILATTKHADRCAVMSGETNDDLLYRCAALGAREFFQKPLAVERVIAWASQGIAAPGQVASGGR
jgi:DNA-binding NtrC family response regulator